MKCKICDNESGNTKYEVKEMMFGFRDKFIYFQCSKCKCLQILEIPKNIAKYYPDNYYSFSLYYPKGIFNKIIKYVKKLRFKAAILNKDLVGKLIFYYFPNIFLKTLSEIGIKKDTSILDVGSGSGEVIHDLKNIGIKNILGVDPYIKNNILYKNGLEIQKKSIHELNSKWNFIMFNHAFEHLDNPLETLNSVYGLLSDNGICMIRIPIVSSFAWKKYKENWVQLDAPRHLFLHSVKSIILLAEKSNLIVEKIVYDSNDLQFWGSEQYIKDIPLMDDCSYMINKKKSIFSKKEINNYKIEALKLNNKGKGDQCAFILRKI